MEFSQDQKRIGEAYERYIAARTPILIQPSASEDVFKDGNGSGVFLTNNGHLYILTAKHVADGFSTYLVTFKEAHLCRPQFSEKIKIDSIHRHLNCDLALIEIDQGLLSYLGMQSLTISDMDSSESFSSELTYAWGGWPKPLRKEQESSFGFYFVATKLILTDRVKIYLNQFQSSNPTTEPYNERYDIFLEDKSAGVSIETGKIMVTNFRLDGLSGGGFWRLLAPSHKNMIWDPTKIKLIGIEQSVLLGDRPNTRWVRGTKMQPVIDMINKIS